MSLAHLKKNSSDALDKLKDAAKQTSAKPKETDLWRPTFDPDKGAGSAVIRFMPAVEGEDLPWVKLIRHAFKGKNGRWYIENSLRTIGQDDPVSLLNSKLWNSGVESDKDVARSQKQKIEYTTNVYIIRDPSNPENEGKVMKYRFGPMIFEMIQNAMFPKFEGDQPLDPFNPYHGANFNIRIVGKKVGQDTVPNYEKSSFSTPSALFDGDDEKIEAAYAKCHPLKQIIAPENFKTPEELKKKLLEVLGPVVGSGVPVVEGYAAPVGSTPAPTSQEFFDAEPQSAAPSEPSTVTVAGDDDEDAAFLRSLMEG